MSEIILDMVRLFWLLVLCHLGNHFGTHQKNICSLWAVVDCCRLSRIRISLKVQVKQKYWEGYINLTVGSTVIWVDKCMVVPLNS